MPRLILGHKAIILDSPDRVRLFLFFLILAPVVSLTAFDGLNLLGCPLGFEFFDDTSLFL